METETKTAIETLRVDIDVNENLMAEVEKLAKDGWQLLPGAKPYAVYHLIREKNKPDIPKIIPAQTSSGFGKLGIDDSKIFMMRDGKPVG